jgi:hypothetical protein
LPVTLIVNVPRGVDLLVRTVSVEEPPAPTGLGLKLAVVDPGRPLAESEADPVKPFFAATVTAYVVLEPAVTVRDVGETVSAKSGG